MDIEKIRIFDCFVTKDIMYVHKLVTPPKIEVHVKLRFFFGPGFCLDTDTLPIPNFGIV